jgi:hypothetical protein
MDRPSIIALSSNSHVSLPETRTSTTPLLLEMDVESTDLMNDDCPNPAHIVS